MLPLQLPLSALQLLLSLLLALLRASHHQGDSQHAHSCQGHLSTQTPLLTCPHQHRSLLCSQTLPFHLPGISLLKLLLLLPLLILRVLRLLTLLGRSRASVLC